MKTIQKLYQQLLEGKVTKSKFLYEARRDESLKQYVTNLTSFDDSIKILKNRGVITEAKKSVDCLTLDSANPYEYEKGLQCELGTEYQSTPQFISVEAFQSAQTKILTNLAKDPNFYTKKIAGIKAKADLSSEAFRGGKSSRSDVYTLVKGGSLTDKKNAMTSGKKEKANVKDTLGDKERAKSKTAGIKIDGQNPKAPKKIKLKENLGENIPAANTSVLPFNSVQPGMKAFDDSGDQFKVLAKGKYQDLKRYDSLKAFDKFLSSDPTGVDANQVVAIIDGGGNTMVRAYGVGGVYVYGDNQDEAVVVKPDSPEADPNRLKKYTDKGMDIKLDPNMKEMKLSRIVKQVLREVDAEFEAAITNKEIPQSETEIAEAKALVLPIITKANLAKNVDLDRDIALKNGNIWVQVHLGNGLLSKEMQKALTSEGNYLGANPVNNTTITLVFSKSK